MPDVTVIVPVFNDAAGVLSCLGALAGQTYPADRFEVVIVDNGSTPPLILPETFAFTVRVTRCETPGSYAARNAGVKAAAGKILAFTDADCIPRPEWIEQGVIRLSREGGRCIVGGEVRIVEPAERRGVSLYQFVTGFSQRENIEQKGFSATANLFCPVREFMASGPFDERLLSGGDREWAWRSARSGFRVVFEKHAVVETRPRTSLRAAIRQARRVAAGRKFLREHGLDHIGPQALAPHRSPLQSIRWILRQRQLSWWERIKVLQAATLLKGAGHIEAMRLHFGGSAERR